METVDHIRNLPALALNDVQIWGVHVPQFADRLDSMLSVLSDGERDKAGRFRREADRNASIAGRGALRVLLSGHTGIAADRIRFSYSESGKPHVADSNVAFNVSHSGEWVVLALGRDRAVGVDIEQIRRNLDAAAIANRYLTPAEQERINQADDPCVAFFRLWVRKEAYVKACGSTLFSELSSFSVPYEDGEKDGWHFHYLEAGSKYAAAVVSDKPIRSLPCYDFGGMNWEE